MTTEKNERQERRESFQIETFFSKDQSKSWVSFEDEFSFITFDTAFVVSTVGRSAMDDFFDDFDFDKDGERNDWVIPIHRSTLIV